ncbi:MAG: LysE family transporter [Actinomycetota bacterium]|nr:LysE family transporter [Actinomycetota bacterium]
MAEMLELVKIFTAALGIAFSGAMVPGPLLTVTIFESARRGSGAGFLIVVGHAALELVLVIGFLFGLQRFLGNPFVVRAIGVVGGVFLLWMGFGMLRGYARRVVLNLDGDEKKIRLGPFAEGIVVSLSNPYWTIWWITIGLALAIYSLKYGLLGLSVFYVGHILGDFIWYGLVIAGVVSGRRFLSDRVYRAILLVCGLFLILLAVCFILGLKLF